jgi:hypothetical protein
MSDMTALLDKFLSWILNLLPLSPFTDIISSMEQLPFLGYLNWFVPVGKMLAVGTAWLVAIGVYYLYSVIARWIKLIS